MQYTLQWIDRRISELAYRRVTDRARLGPLTAQRLDGTEIFIIRTDERWGTRDMLYSITGDVHVPPAWQHDLVALHLDLCDPHHRWDVFSAEGLLSINGVAVHAIDRFHREIILPPELAIQDILHMQIQMWTGMDVPYHTAGELSLQRIDPVIDTLHRNVTLLRDLLGQIPDDASLAIHITTALQDSLNVIDYRDVRALSAYLHEGDPQRPLVDDHFIASCAHASVLLMEHLQRLQLPLTREQPQLTIIGHAHIDVAWLWQLKHTHLKVANTFATALYHMDRYPQFQFMHSTPQIYAWIKDEYPEVFARIKARVAAGQWEVEGGMWVEADTNITGAESLVRQFLYGQRFFREEFGTSSKILWLPDVFGYSGSLPQIIQQAGCEYFVTAKIGWNDTNRFPYDTFWWEGIDGTRILTQFLVTPEPFMNPWTYGYNADLTYKTVIGTWRNYQQKTINNEALMTYGWGDGGGGPMRSMIESVDLLARPLSRDIPVVATGHARDFMDRLAQRIGDDPRVPVWSGELYLEYHRGTYTSQAHTKRNNRFAERDLHMAEFVASLAAILTDQSYPRLALQPIWEQLLTHQFHDILPGSSIGAVYQDAEANYAGIREAAYNLTRDALENLATAIDAPKGSQIVFNDLSWQRDVTVALDGHMVLIRDVPALGWRIIDATEYADLPTLKHTQKLTLPTTCTTPYYTILFNDKGQISSLYDLIAQREILADGECGNVFLVFDDKPNNFDAWDIDANYAEHCWELDALVSAVITEQSPLRTILSFTWKYHERTTITQSIIIAHHSPRIDFSTMVNWHEQSTLLKVDFPVAIHAQTATAAIQWGTIERPTHRNTSWDQARFESCAHAWIDASEGDYGVALLNDSKYGYDVHEHTSAAANIRTQHSVHMRLSLLKGGVYPDTMADQGHHTFTYSLLPHSGDWYRAGVHRAAYELNHPAIVVEKQQENKDVSLPPTWSLAEISPDNLIIETIKLAEESDNLVIRMYETRNQRGTYRLKMPFVVRQARQANLLEEPQAVLVLDIDQQTIMGTYHPYEIMTIVIER